jgi:DNA invertase Pin-like site-specific DNA recombinase
MSDLYNLLEELTKSGVTVEFLREGLKFGSGKGDATSRLLLGVVGSVAEFERELIRERQAEGIRAAKARGAYKGRKIALSDAAVDGARRRIESGVPKAAVARDLGVCRQTLYDALSRHVTCQESNDDRDDRKAAPAKHGG